MNLDPYDGLIKEKWIQKYRYWFCEVERGTACKSAMQTMTYSANLNNTAISLDNYMSIMIKKIKVIIMGASDLTFQSVSFLICKIGYDTYLVELSKL